MTQYWFKNRKYGIGWRPVRWQGWFVTLLYVAAVFVVIIRIDTQIDSGPDVVTNIFAPFAALTFLLLVIVWRTGEPLDWRLIKKEEKRNHE